MSVAEELVIQALAATEAELREHIANLEADVAVYREIAQAALDALRQVTVAHQTLQRTNHDLRDEFRAFRERVMLDGLDDEDEAA